MKINKILGLLLVSGLSVTVQAESFTPGNYVGIGDYHGTNTSDVGFHLGLKASDKIGVRMSASPLYGAVFRGSLDYHLSDNVIVSAGVSSFHFDWADTTESGGYATIGYFTRFGERFDFGVEVGYEDTFSGTTLVAFDLNYNFTENLSAGYKFIRRSKNGEFDTGSYYLRYRF